jgi:hypothetical protein
VLVEKLAGRCLMSTKGILEPHTQLLERLTLPDASLPSSFQGGDRRIRILDHVHRLAEIKISEAYCGLGKFISKDKVLAEDLKELLRLIRDYLRRVDYVAKWGSDLYFWCF